jgi:hypothetical protein
VCEINHLLDIASGQVETRTLAKNAFIAKAFRLIFEDFTPLSASARKKYIDILVNAYILLHIDALNLPSAAAPRRQQNLLTGNCPPKKLWRFES